MLLWSGIEGLLGVDGELRRRIALHAAILFNGSLEEKTNHFHQIKKAYDFRSKVVHGGKIDTEKLSAEYRFASNLLRGLLSTCVILKRVPTARELDEAALNTIIQ